MVYTGFTDVGNTIQIEARSTMDTQKLGKNIQLERVNRKLTQDELAKRANMSRTYLADVENGRYNPSMNMLERIATALQIPLYALIPSEDRVTLSENQQHQIHELLVDGARNRNESINFVTVRSKISTDFFNRLERGLPVNRDDLFAVARYLSVEDWVQSILDAEKPQEETTTLAQKLNQLTFEQQELVLKFVDSLLP